MRQFMNNTCGLKLVLLFPIFSANGSRVHPMERLSCVGATQVAGLGEARRRYIITRTRVPTKMLPFTASHAADRKNALWVPFRRVTIFNIPIVPFQQGNFRVRIVKWRTFSSLLSSCNRVLFGDLRYQARIASWWISLVVDQLSFKSSISFTHN